MSEAFVWWATVGLLGLIALPFTFSLFKNLPDRGYAFGKALSILLVSYLLWIAASLHILPNTRWAIVLVVALLAWAALIMAIRRRRELVTYLRENRNVIIAVEALFLLAFVLWTVVRAYNPDILSTEKPMDFAFVNGIMRSEYFPPLDPWLSGEHLNNYYFGHVMMATLTTLTGIGSEVTFNLSVALVFALAAIGAFGLVYNLVRMSRGSGRAAMGFGLTAAAFLVVLGNLEGVVEILYAHGLGGEGFWGWIGIEGMNAPYHSGQWYPTEWWWWWRATRMVQVVVGGVQLDYTIAEFPSFSFVLGDLHGHVLSLPVVLLGLGVSLNVLATKVSVGLSWLRRNILPFALMLICIGALGPVHSWDLPIYVSVFLAAMLIAARLRHNDARWWKEWLVLSAIAVAGIFLLYLPFYLSLDSPVSGILPWTGPNTRYLYYFLIWGLFLFVGVSFLLVQIRGGLRSLSWRGACLVPLAILLPWVLWAVVAAVTGGGGLVWGKLGHLAPMLIVLAGILLVVVRKTRNADLGERSALFALLLFFAAFLLTVGCELFYVKEVFGNRMNTVFRFYFQAWVMLAVASSFAVYYVHCRWKVSRVLTRVAKSGWWVLLLVFVVASLLYPVAATWSKTGGLSGSATLDGLVWLRRDHPDEWEAISWLRDNVDGAAVMASAPGGAYTDHGIVSECTGIPTVLGWEHHEWVWRGSDEAYRGRKDDLEQIYVSGDQDEVEALLEKYDVTYVYVGRLEEDMYGDEVWERFDAFLEKAYESSGVTIYERSGQ